MRFPKDTPNKAHLPVCRFNNGVSLDELNSFIEEKFPNIPKDELRLYCEEIQVDCFGYDQYDSNDWMNFIIVEKV